MTDIETRSFRVPFELRTDGENQTIVGYASTFDQPYPVDMVTEIIDRSAFTRTLSEKPDVYALIGHDPSRILGRTKNGTLSLSIDERGLKCVITPVMTRDAEDTLKLIASGCIDAMSFGFKVVKQAFGYADGKTTRRITDLELHEVSCVAFPANENATLSLRAKQMAREFRASQFETRSASVRLTVKKMSRAEPFPSSGSLVFDGKTVYQVVSDDSYLTDAKTVSVEAKRIGEPTDFSEEQMLNAYKGTLERSSSARLETRAKTPKRFSARMNPSGGTWDITVETEGGKTVYEYQFPDNSNGADPEDEQTSLIDDGFLKHTTDYKGLANYMVHIGVMQSGDELFKEGDLTGDLKHHATGWVGRSSSARLETRGAQLIMAFLPTNQTFRAFYGDPKGDPSEWSAENNLLRSWGAPINTKKELKYFAEQENYTLKQISKGIYTLTSGGSRSSSTMKLLELRNSIASPIDTETRGLADFALMASAGLGLFLVSKIVSGVLFFWYDCAYNTYGGGKKKVRVSAKTDKDAMAEVKKLNPDAQDIEVQKVKK